MKISKKKYSLAAVCAAMVILLIFKAYFFTSAPPLHYLFDYVKKRDITKMVLSTGVIVPSQIVQIGAQVSGQIKKLHVQRGQRLVKGTLIAELDSTTQANELDSLKAQLDMYTAQLQARRVALATASSKYKRGEKLRKDEAVSMEVFEATQADFARAQAEIIETESLIRRTRISLSTAEANLRYTLITAPMDGTIIAIPVEEGQTVNANQSTPTIVILANLDIMEIKMLISEGDITKIAPGMPVVFSILSEPDKIFSGVIGTIDPADTILTESTDSSYVSPTDKSAVYYYARMSIKNVDGYLRNSMTAECVITIFQQSDVLTIPTLALIDKEGQKFVTIVDKNGNLLDRAVQIGTSNHDYTQIKSGLREGEKIVTVRMTESEITEAIENL